MLKKYNPLLLWVLIFSLCLPVVTQAKTLKELQQEKAELESKKKDAKATLEDLANKQEDISAEISQLDQAVAQAQTALEETQTKLTETTVKLNASEEALEKATVAKDGQLETFQKRIKFIYENGTIGYLKIIMEAENFNDFLVRTQYVNDIMNYDKTTLDELKKNEEIIQTKTSEIAEEKVLVETLVVEQKTKSDELNVKLAEKQSAYEKYRLDASKYEQELASWDKASIEVEQLIAKATAPPPPKPRTQTASRSSSGGTTNTQSGSAQGSVVYTGGSLQWPVPGRSYISSGYGYRSRPIGSGSEFHTGYDIPAGYGESIVAAEGGSVIYARYMNGYGYTVMIDHGNGLVTLYGHNSSLVVSEGQSVSRGQAIARAGSTGNSTGNHCHFEVRSNGKHTSPRPYLGV